jgi:hypothetical protein
MSKRQNSVKTVYAHDHKAVIVCEHCGNTKEINTSPYEKLKKPLRIKCGCGFRFLIALETRKYYRKPTRLDGEYVKVDAESVADRIIVRNLSRTGVGFETVGSHALQLGDLLWLRFTLDDRKRTKIRKKVVVKNIQDRFVGAEFCNLGPYESGIGFYLMNG